MEFVSKPATGYFVEPVAAYPTDASYYHFFCGTQAIQGAWCANCNKPLLQLLTVDATDPRVDLADTHKLTIPLLYCWRCGIAKSDFFYEVVAEDHIRILEYGQGEEEADFPYSAYPVFFPGSPCILRELTEEQQRILDGLSCGELAEADAVDLAWDLTQQPHQVGGRPFFLQLDSGDSLDCPLCGCTMAFFANIGDRCLDPRGLVGYSQVQLLFHICHRCSVIGARNRTD